MSIVKTVANSPGLLGFLVLMEFLAFMIAGHYMFVSFWKLLIVIIIALSLALLCGEALKEQGRNEQQKKDN